MDMRRMRGLLWAIDHLRSTSKIKGRRGGSRKWVPTGFDKGSFGWGLQMGQALSLVLLGHFCPIFGSILGEDLKHKN